MNHERKILYKLNESADTAMVLDNDSSYNIASQIALNNKGEYDAIEGYDKLIPWLESVNDQESIDIVRSIIAEEKKHIDELNKILFKYDKGIQAEESH